MFQLSLVDHIRLSFGSIVGAYEGHTEAAARLARWAWYAKAGILVLLGLSAGASIASVMRGAPYTLAAAALSAIADAFPSAMLGAIAAQVQGAVELASGDARAALVPLRRAWQVWQELAAPYESRWSARSRGARRSTP